MYEWWNGFDALVIDVSDVTLIVTVLTIVFTRQPVLSSRARTISAHGCYYIKL